MLQYTRNGQPITRLGGSRSQETSSNERQLCYLCLVSPFGPAVVPSYQAAWKSRPEKVPFTYQRPTSEVRRSALAGCPWCELVADAILLSVKLDYSAKVLEAMQEDASGGEGDSNDDSVGYSDLEHDDEMSENMEQAKKDSHEKVEEGQAHASGVGSIDPTQEYFRLQPRFLDDSDDLPGKPKDLDGSDNYSLLMDDSLCHITIWYLDKSLSPGTEYNTLDVSVEVESFKPDDPLAGLIGDASVDFICDLYADHVTLAGQYVSARPPLKKLSVDGIVRQAMQWLSKCKTHETCVKVGKNWAPTRLIDVRDSNAAYLRPTQLGEDLEYVALSYVWGLEQLYTTTVDALDQKTAGLDYTRIPQTIKDAMDVTRALGFGFLWVDSLCIIQDSPRDKRQEISQMRIIYQNAALTIAACRGATVADGLFGDLEPPQYYLKPFKLPFYCPNGEISSVMASCRVGYSREIDPWNSRAWTLEEQLLSQRLLIFSNSGLKQFCKLDAMQNHSSSAFKRSFLSLPWNSRDERLSMTSNELRELWHSILTDYTERSVTHAKDKLVAFAAVAEEFHRVGAGVYLAGLWREHLVMDLQWRRDLTSERNPFRARPEKYRAPSWSWAAVDGYSFIPDLEDPREPAFSEIIECTVVLESQLLPFGPVAQGKLTINGPLVSGRWTYTDYNSRGCDGLILAATPRRGSVEAVAEVSLDAFEPYLHEKDGGTEVHCLPLALVHNLRDEVEGLVLLPAEDGAYRRIGYFSGCSYRGWFSSVQSKIIHIL